MKEVFISRVNRFATAAKPFFFLIDFEKKKPLVFSSQEAFEQNILFDINGYKNYTSVPAAVSPVKVKIDAVAFEQYKKAVAPRIRIAEAVPGKPEP